MNDKIAEEDKQVTFHLSDKQVDIVSDKLEISNDASIESGDSNLESPGRRRSSGPEKRVSLLFQPHISDLSDVMALDDIDYDEPGSPDHEKARRKRPTLSRSAGAHYFSHRDLAYNPSSKFTLYSPPRQRQKWGDNQVLPRVNWGDLFFDLFYVAASFNLGGILVDSPTKDGLLYFVGVFFSMLIFWNDKTYFDSRFVVEDDLFHRTFEVALLVITATAAKHIRPANYLKQPAEYIDMFAFSLAITLGALMHLIRGLEITFFGKGQKDTVRNAGIGDVNKRLVQVAMYIAATIYTGVQYYSRDNDYDKARTLAEEEILSTSTGASDTTQKDCYDHIPIYLILVGTILRELLYTIRIAFFFPTDGSHQKLIVPMNVDFFIHRNGEWTMLILGESILSLLVVAGEGKDHNFAFYTGISTVILLQYLHFRSQPHHADEHALRRSIRAGIVYVNASNMYTGALVAVGASYKLFLKEYQDEHNCSKAYSAKDSLRQLLFMYPDNDEVEDHLTFDGMKRFLAEAAGGANEASYYDDSCIDVKFKCWEQSERRQYIANLFCASLAIAWFCLDIMILCHVGIKEQLKSCKDLDSTHGGGRKLQIKGSGLIFVQFFLIAFVATISQYETDPNRVMGLALIAVFAQLGTRLLSDWLFDDDDNDNEPSHDHL